MTRVTHHPNRCLVAANNAALQVNAAATRLNVHVTLAVIRRIASASIMNQAQCLPRLLPMQDPDFGLLAITMGYLDLLHQALLPLRLQGLLLPVLPVRLLEPSLQPLPMRHQDRL
jgi:hypothetical protein